MQIVDLTGDWEGRDPLDDYEVIKNELAEYAADLAARPRIVVANKIDAPRASRRSSHTWSYWISAAAAARAASRRSCTFVAMAAFSSAPHRRGEQDRCPGH